MVDFRWSHSFKLTRRDVVFLLVGAAFALFWARYQTSADIDTAIVLLQQYRDLLAQQSLGSTGPHPLPEPVDADGLSPETVQKHPPELLDLPDPPSRPLTPSLTKYPVNADAPLSLPETSLVAHAPGWTIFENLYMFNGTLFILTDTPNLFPDRFYVTSTGLKAENTPENIASRIPTEKEMDFVTSARAKERWDNRVWSVDGLTFLYNDPPQFLNHYYHFCGETLLGTWAFYSGLDTKITQDGHTSLPPPDRVIFSHTSAAGWRDTAQLNQFFLYSMFPSTSLEMQEDWESRIRMTKDGTRERAWRLDRVMVHDRSAAFKGDHCGGRINNARIASEPFEMNKEWRSKWWWDPARRSVLRFAGVPDDVLNISQKFKRTSAIEMPGRVGGVPVVITYINRQPWHRRLIPEDHISLVSALDELCTARGWELNVVKPEKLSRDGQLGLFARTTVLIGVHGNGLTHLITMAPTPISTVIEIFYPKGFAKDYQWTATALGHRHFGVWNDSYWTEPNLPSVDYPEGFQGITIPVHGPTVAKLVAGRVDGHL